jgi:cobalt/nickel transport system ATP-binding protein
MILSAHDLRHSYEGEIASLNGLSLKIERAKKLAILGANGAGKTTLLLHLNGSLKPNSGEIRLDGEKVGYDRAGLIAWRRRVGMVLQDPDDQLFAPSVLADVAFGPLNLGMSDEEARERAISTLAELRIAELAPRPPHLLSLGQKKRVAIAGIVAMRPDVLLLDEPAAGLDAHGTAHLLAVLDRLVEDGATIVFSTHDTELALAWADEAAIFGHGVVLRHGTPVDLLSDRELLRQARLKMPWPIEIGLAIDPIAPPPRRRAEVLELLKRNSPEKPGEHRNP